MGDPKQQQQKQQQKQQHQHQQQQQQQQQQHQQQQEHHSELTGTVWVGIERRSLGIVSRSAAPLCVGSGIVSSRSRGWGCGPSLYREVQPGGPPPAPYPHQQAIPIDP
ncbi:uncharacterized protein EMH_0062990 [Eimeria mitis]|uniref:Uncharacterized protein n=1 Tax=Eimeria mitis TaxID=44415 RepID=U6K3S5_9EIME|nr:uncharacterized protein EMH_0062990 [Eimeria mitis]CDJ30982.1 hypothetical protein EMH_0062990 [Eimeria mitis]